MCADGALERQSPADVSDGLRQAMRRLASGVALVTINGPDGPAGMAVTSITSLSLDPPSVLICVNQRASLHDRLAMGSRFGLTVLSAAQQEVAQAFGDPAARARRFAGEGWSFAPGGGGALAGSQANLSCTVDQLVAYGTHSIVIARVEAVDCAPDGEPLIYHDGRYL